MITHLLYKLIVATEKRSAKKNVYSELYKLEKRIAEKELKCDVNRYREDSLGIYSRLRKLGDEYEFNDEKLRKIAIKDRLDCEKYIQGFNQAVEEEWEVSRSEVGELHANARNKLLMLEKYKNKKFDIDVNDISGFNPFDTRYTEGVFDYYCQIHARLDGYDIGNQFGEFTPELFYNIKGYSTKLQAKLLLIRALGEYKAYQVCRDRIDVLSKLDSGSTIRSRESFDVDGNVRRFAERTCTLEDIKNNDELSFVDTYLFHIRELCRRIESSIMHLRRAKSCLLKALTLDPDSIHFLTVDNLPEITDVYGKYKYDIVRVFGNSFPEYTYFTEKNTTDALFLGYDFNYVSGPGYLEGYGIDFNETRESGALSAEIINELLEVYTTLKNDETEAMITLAELSYVDPITKQGCWLNSDACSRFVYGKDLLDVDAQINGVKVSDIKDQDGISEIVDNVGDALRFEMIKKLYLPKEFKDFDYEYYEKLAVDIIEKEIGYINDEINMNESAHAGNLMMKRTHTEPLINMNLHDGHASVNILDYLSVKRVILNMLDTFKENVNYL